jgi:hypothetical protein
MIKIRVIFAIAFTVAVPFMASAAYRLPDTGQTTCYSTDTFAVIPCESSGQDGNYSINAMSFTDNGNGTVTDNNSGLMWQKENGGDSYNWYVASGIYDATSNPGSTNVCGSLALGDYSDWRLPSKKELVSLVDYSVASPGPTINAVFTGSLSSFYWTSADLAGSQTNGWAVSFNDGHVSYVSKTATFPVRCVRGGNAAVSLNDNGNGTVTDTGNGLTWHKITPAPMNLGAALSYCENSTLADYSDWRLPNVKELESWFDDSRSGPAINTDYFQGAMSGAYWTSTTFAGMFQSAWGIEASNGVVSFYNKSNELVHNVQCVRGGAVGFLSLGFPGTGSGTVTGSGVRYGEPVSFSTNTVLTDRFDLGTTVNLTASPAEFSLFTGWSGSCSGTGSCSIDMDSDKSVAATFTKNFTNSIVINGTSTFYSSLQAAYNNSAAGSKLKVWATEYSENLNANLAKAITIAGGYNSGFSAVSGYTTLYGILTISRGSLTVGNLIIR